MIETHLQANDPAQWEQSYRTHVQSGKIGIDDWLWMWLWHRIDMPDKQYSVFNEQKVIEAQLMDIRVELTSDYRGKKRLVNLIIYSQNAYHPDFEATALVDDAHWRFPSIGNPAVDRPNYRWWEEYLLFKLGQEVLVEQGGLAHLIEQVHRRLG